MAVTQFFMFLIIIVLLIGIYAELRRMNREPKKAVLAPAIQRFAGISPPLLKPDVQEAGELSYRKRVSPQEAAKIYEEDFVQEKARH